MKARFLDLYFPQMPECDKEDYMQLDSDSPSKQAAPEFAHEVYAFMLQQEQRLTNYLRGDSLRERDRDQAAERILDLCKEKGYRKETHLLAVSIFDRYLALTHEQPGLR